MCKNTQHFIFLCYNKNMNRNIKKHFILFMALIFVLLASANFLPKNSGNVYADDQIDETYAIKNDESILSSQLWNALYNFYTANKAEGMKTLTDSLYINIFSEFTVTTLNLSGNQISSISNLSLFDLSKFDSINLSNNKLSSLDGQLKTLSYLKNLDVSKNSLTSFSYADLNNTSYSTNLQSVNVSQNSITTLNLQKIANGTVDAQQNLITSSKLVLPENTDVVVKLSHNLLNNITTEQLANTNLSFGFQGAKNGATYVSSLTIHFYGLDDLTSIDIYSEDKTDRTIISKIATTSTTYDFSIGYYLVRFKENATQSLYMDIDFYIAPEAPTAKMFDGDKEVELSHKINSKVAVKFYGRENAEIHFTVNNSGDMVGDTYSIDSEGVKNITVYQMVDGYKSASYTLYVSYQASTALPWIYVIFGTVAFALIFFCVIKFMPNIVNIGMKDKDKKSLD